MIIEFERVTEAVRLVEWLADQPCTGNGSGMRCRDNAPHDPQWCCPPCRASLIAYPPTKVD